MRKTKKKAIEHYSLNQILKTNAHYNIIIGERSNGKTYSILTYGLKKFIEDNEQMAILRRFSEDFTGQRGSELFSDISKNGYIRELTNGEWTDVYYYSSRWYLCRYENDKGRNERITHDTPFAFGFAISQQEHDKGSQYPNVTTIFFDEFITRGGYLRDEFILFMNTISTIVRKRNNVKIFMAGNTVNKYCPYFNEMGLRHIKEMKQGAIDVYALTRDDNTELRIAVEYCKPTKKGKQSDFYFSFDNQKLKMITNGEWEINIYPHCPYKFKPKDIKFTYFIDFDDDLLQCEIVNVDSNIFTYIHRKTTPLKNPDNDLIYSQKFDSRFNWRRKITKPILDIEKQIAMFYKTDKVFYQDNEVGEIVRNYLIWCNG